MSDLAYKEVSYWRDSVSSPVYPSIKENMDVDVAIIGGEGHVPGLKINTDTRYQRLAKYAKEHFGVSEIKYRWSDRDYLSYDNIPLIGKLYPWSRNLYVGTAFQKWGLTGGTVAGIILRDLICDQKNPWTDTFNSNRLKPLRSIPKTFAEHIR